MIKIILVSDTHGKHKELSMPEGDCIIHCGDFSNRGRPEEVYDFLEWFSSLNFKHKIFIAGNHDISFEKDREFKRKVLSQYKDVVYLEDDIWVVDDIILYGSPYTPTFNNWAFMLPRDSDDIYKKWEEIPLSIDILITHGPPYGVLDRTSWDGTHVGCKALRNRIEKIKPRYHIFGHVHESNGVNPYSLDPTVCINASNCNLKYRITSNPYIIEV